MTIIGLEMCLQIIRFDDITGITDVEHEGQGPSADPWGTPLLTLH